MNKNRKDNGEAVDFIEEISLISQMGDIPDNPWTIIERWIPIKENATERSCVGTLAIVDGVNAVSSRTMNVKLQGEQLLLATHRGSKKWRGDLIRQPASWHVYWPKQRRQIDIRGTLVEAPTALAEDWWDKRPANMDLVSTLSRQSQSAPYAAIDDIRRRAREGIDGSVPKDKLPKPETFIVLKLIPFEIEFWEGTFDRVHNRYLFENEGGSEWNRSLLFP